MFLMYTHPLFKKRRRLSPPQASLGSYECASSRSEKRNQEGCLVLSGPVRKVLFQAVNSVDQ
jgi:hypothetical protein